MRYAWFTVWVIAVSIPLSFAAGIHYAALPAGSPRQAMPGEGGVSSARLSMAHFLAAGCPCSALVAEHLAARGPATNADERVYIIGDDLVLKRSLVARGYAVENIAPEQAFARMGVSGGPVLRISNAFGTVVYSGGYAPARPRSASDMEDMALLERCKTVSPEPYPAYGCATSDAARRAIDPLGLKY